MKVGSDAKRTVGRVVLVEPGDIACYLTLEDDRGQGFGEMAAFEICEQKPSIRGKRVALSYVQANVMSPDCVGVADCRKTVPKVIVSRARILE